jgi:arginyl-tRNA synthetase
VIDLKTELESWLAQGVAAVSGVATTDAATGTLERPKQPQHGDYASNAALQLGKKMKRNPRELAQAIVAALPASPWIARTEIAGAGFINIFVSPAARQSVLATIIALRDAFGRGREWQGRAVIVEFVSANPTGPLHVGHGRQGALGDAIANLLEAQGARVTREFYYNDAGAQIQNLAISVRARAQELLGEHATFPEDGYRGEYIRELAQRYLDENGPALGDIDAIRRFAVAEMRREQDRDLQAFGVGFDNYYLESSLYETGRVDKTVERLAASGRTYAQDGALWLKTTDFGDDKDRVMRKSDGGYTYFVPDVAYHVTKWERGFAKAINVQGSDHHSTVARVRAGPAGARHRHPAGYPDYVLHKMVTRDARRRGGEDQQARGQLRHAARPDRRGRPRRGALLPRVAQGRQRVRVRLDLARAQTEENPVYYVQYAHARVCSVMRQAGVAPRARRARRRATCRR